jgi:hypothetical protein
MACHFKFDGTLDRSAAERAQGRSDRSPILDGLVTAIREADTHEVLVRIVENIRIDARYFELGDVLNLLERVDFDGTVRYRTVRVLPVPAVPREGECERSAFRSVIAR